MMSRKEKCVNKSILISGKYLLIYKECLKSFCVYNIFSFFDIYFCFPFDFQSNSVMIWFFV